MKRLARTISVVRRLAPFVVAFLRDRRTWILFGRPAVRPEGHHQKRADRLTAHLASLGAGFVADARQLEAFVGDALPLTDDFPRRLGSPVFAPARQRELAEWQEPAARRRRFLASDFVRRAWPEALRERMITADGLARVQIFPEHDLNGEEAIRLLAEHGDEIDLALIDVIMPKRSGREVFQAVRETRKDLPVLFTSGYSFEVIDPGYLPDEELNLMQKPYEARALLARLRELLDG